MAELPHAKLWWFSREQVYFFAMQKTVPHALRVWGTADAPDGRSP